MAQISPTRVLYEAAGAPPVDGAVEIAARCAICAFDDGAFIPAKKALRSGFSDYAALKVPTSDQICAACSWTMAGIPPKSLRAWSVLYRTDQELPESAEASKALGLGSSIFLTNRGSTIPLAEALLNPPAGTWFMSIAVSGQKHILPFATFVYGGPSWVIRFDGADISSDAKTFATVLFHVGSLRGAGFSADEIATLEPRMSHMQGDGLTAWMEHSAAIAPYRGAPLVDLANYLLTKENNIDIITIADRCRAK